MAVAVGIDLGTSHSAIAFVDATGQPRMIPNSLGHFLTPSIISFVQDPPIVGREAKSLLAMGDPSTIAYFKRVVGDPNWRFHYDGHEYSPTNLSSLVLSRLKQSAETYLNQTICDAVITVPAYFSTIQRQSVIDAASAAELNCLGIVNEPSAAALSYGLDHKEFSGRILVYDLGGGTFDCTLADIDHGKIEVIGTLGNHELGGKDWDDVLARYIAVQFMEQFGLDPLDDPTDTANLMAVVEEAKLSLSSLSKAICRVSCGNVSGSVAVLRATYEELSVGLVNQTKVIVETLLRDAHCPDNNIDAILCVGGATRMPMVRNMLQSRFRAQILSGVNADEAVVLGAAIRAHAETRHQLKLPQPASVAEAMPLPRLEHDVMSHSLGMIAIADDRSRYINSRLISRNQPLPATATRAYRYRFSEESPGLDVFITQGESEDPSQCELLGKYHFHGFEETGDTAILDISYAYDQNGLVDVRAVQRGFDDPLPFDVVSIDGHPDWLGSDPNASNTTKPEAILLAIDLSGSMEGKPLDTAREAALQFISRMDLDLVGIGIIAVADEALLVQSLTSKEPKLLRAIDKLQIDMVGYTNSAHPFEITRQAFKKIAHARTLIVLTDGIWTNRAAAIAAAQVCHDDGIEIVAVGFGNADEAFLGEIATSESNVFFTELSQLTSSFDRVAQELNERRAGIRFSEMVEEAK